MARSVGRIAVALFALACLAPPALRAQVNSSTPGWFPFVFPGFDARPTAVDLSYLNIKPAGRDGFLRTQEGVLRDGAGRRVRWFGVNLAGDACFPEKAVAPLVAARLAKLGINLVRLQSMDGPGSAREGLSLINYPANTALRADTLDRLDFFLAELKKQGIYFTLTLHTTRTYPGTPPDFRFSHMLDLFYPPFIAAFKQFTRDLLTHRNPYTGNTYAEEPALACIGVNNEDTLALLTPELLAGMPEPFLGELKRRWMTWLRAKYGTTEGLRAAWGVDDGQLGPNLVANPNFANNAQGWALQNSGGAQSSLAPLPDGTPGTRWSVARQGTLNWHVQLLQRGLNLVEGEPYRLQFRARSDANRPLAVSVILDEDPFSLAGLSDRPELTTAWQEFSYPFFAEGTRPNHIRVNFNALNQLGFFDLAAVALQKLPSGVLLSNETFENNNIPFTPTSLSLKARRDFTAFLIDTEHAYAQEMHRFIREELGARPIIYHSQTLYGGMAGAVRERKASDLADTHGYWQHPQFRGTPFHPVNWSIPNTTQLAAANGGVLTELAVQRVQGMPFTVSEYNTPSPSDYAAETWPLLAAMAAFQDWDGIYGFDYLQFTTQYDGEAIRSWFDMQAHPAHQAFLPLAALLFRTEMVRPATRAVVLTASEGRILTDQTKEGMWSSFDRFWGQVGLPLTVGLLHRTALNLVPGDGPTTVSFTPPLPASGPITSDTGELVWDTTQRTMTLNAPGVRLLLGKAGGRSIAVGDVRFQLGAMGGNEHAHLGLIALDGKPIATSSRLLLVAIGRAENQNMGWNATRTSVGDRWGTGPTVVQGVTGTVTLAQGGWTVVALDATGEPKRTVATNVASFPISPADQTVWYLVSR